MTSFIPALRLHIELKPLLSLVNISLEFSKNVLNSKVKLSIESHHVIVQNENHHFMFEPKGVTFNPASCRGLRWGSATELQFTLQFQWDDDRAEGNGELNDHSPHASNQDFLVSRIQACQSHCYCVGCGAQILKSNCNFQRVLPLPSENWSDFADIWFCHNHSHKNIDSEENGMPPHTDTKSEDINKLKTTPLLPRSEDCLVSSLYMLADGSHFKSSSIISCADRLICKRCGNFLGFVKDKRDRNHDSQGVFKIYFHTVSFRNDVDDETHLSEETLDSFPVNNSHNKHRVEEFMCRLLKDQSRIFTSFRFIISSSLQAKDQSTISILLWLLDQDLTVFSSHITHDEWMSPNPSPRTVSPSKHVKLLYKATFQSFENSHHRSCSPSLDVFQAWRIDNTVHGISLPYPLCKQLLHFLLSSTKQLAPSQRSLNGFHVGYLKAS